jgi:hypothetical protein
VVLIGGSNVQMGRGGLAVGACFLGLAFISGAPASRQSTPPGWRLTVISGEQVLNGTFKASGGTITAWCPANHLMLAFRWKNLHLGGLVWTFGLNFYDRLHPGRWKLSSSGAVMQLGTTRGGSEGWWAGSNGVPPWHGYVELASDLRHGTFKALMEPIQYGAFKASASVKGAFACP